PHALLNYLVRLGWSHGDQEIFSLSEMIALFDLSALNKSAAALNVEKLRWLNQHYLKTDPISTIVPEFLWHLERQHIPIGQGPDISEVIALQRERCKTLVEMVERSRFFYETILPDQTLQQRYL